MVVVGKLVGTFEPAWVTAAIAQANSASARANTIAPSHPAGTADGTNGKGMSQLSASPASTAIAHAIGGRKITFAVSVVSAMAGPLNLAPPSRWGPEPYSVRFSSPAVRRLHGASKLAQCPGCVGIAAIWLPTGMHWLGGSGAASSTLATSKSNALCACGS